MSEELVEKWAAALVAVEEHMSWDRSLIIARDLVSHFPSSFTPETLHVNLEKKQKDWVVRTDQTAHHQSW